MKRLLIGSYALLAVAWAFTNPPGMAPDEPSNYVKALGLRTGQVLGAPRPLPHSVARHYGLDGVPYTYANATTRWVQVPPSLLSDRLACNAFHPTVPAACLRKASSPMSAEQPTYSGAYEPFVYILPSLLSWPAQDPTTAVILIRLGFVITSLALVALAAAMLWSSTAGPLSLVGLLLAATPMVLFSSASISASGPEIGAGLAFAAAIIRISRGAPAPEKHAPSETREVFPWVVFAVSGSVLALARPLGLLWVGCDLMLLLVLVPPRGLLGIWRRPAVLATAGLAGSVTVALAWFIAVIPHLAPTTAEFGRLLAPAIQGLPDNLSQAVGVFGWLDAPMDASAYWLWDFLWVALIVIAITVARAGRRLLLLGLVVAVAAVSVMVSAYVLLPAGLGLQGRHVLPLAVLIPLVAGEIIAQEAGRFSRANRQRFLVCAGGLVALVQFVAWFTNAQREATGVAAPLLFFRWSQWSPPLGWFPWMVVVAVACISLFLGVSRQPAGTDQHLAERRAA